jgi:hypothetical protein
MGGKANEITTEEIRGEGNRMGARGLEDYLIDGRSVEHQPKREVQQFWGEKEKKCPKRLVAAER